MSEANKGRRSLYSAISAMTLTLLNGLLGLVVIRLVISYYGSDFNGLNSTTNQFINLLLIVEGGFTLAANVALFKPLTEGDYGKINGIMSATKSTFLKIGVIFLAVGTVASVFYSMAIKSGLSTSIVFITFMLTIISTGFGLLYATKYQIIIQADQREYILNFIKIGTIVLSQGATIAIIYFRGHMLLIRLAIMIGAIVNSLIIGIACKRKYKSVNFKATPNYAAIKGTSDVFVQNLTGMIYSTLPIVYISVTVGTMFASVYAVYNGVFSLLKGVIYSLVNAPRMGFGKLIAERDRKYVLKVFIQYEYIVICSFLCLLSTASALIRPFIILYSAGISDIDYKNWTVALLLITITFFEVIHIPSGNIINMSGNFKIGKKIQIAACIVLVVSMVVGNQFFGFYGILAAVLITAVLLALLEIIYVHQVYFEKSIGAFLRLLLPSTLLAVGLSYAEILVMPQISGYLQIMIAGFVVVIINGTGILLLNAAVNNRVTNDVISRFKPMAINFLTRGRRK